MSFQSNYKKISEFIILLVIILSGFITTAVFKLNNFPTFSSLDEMLWYSRSAVFWNKMCAFDFSGLVQSLQPGVTVYWFTGFLMKFIDFDFKDVGRRIAEKEMEGLDFNAVVNTNSAETYEIYSGASFAFNAPLFLLTAIFFILFYYLLRRLKFNKVISSLTVFFVATNYFFVYWNTPSDKMLNFFLVLSFLTFLVYVGGAKNRHTEGDITLRYACSLRNAIARKKYLILSAVFGAWAVLAKISAMFILPFYFLAFIFYAWPLDKQKIKSIIKDYLSWIIIFVFVCVIFLPSIIVNPSEIYNLFFDGSEDSVVNQNYSGEGYVSGLSDYFTLLVNVTFMSPAVFYFFLIFLFLKFKKKYRYLFSSLPKKHLQTIAVFITLFILMVTVLCSNHDTRFMSPAFMLINIFSAIGVYAFARMIKEKFKFPEAIYPVAIFVLFLSQLMMIISSGHLIKEAMKKVSGVE
ncbi:MAG: hypothetical protein U9N04_03550 [Patescibacteria group bacterium]|nr:hypothetical protein [Patescibacteria group bacterium]